MESTETSGGVIMIRDAGPDDAAAIAALHLTVWRETYREMAPPAAFERLDLAWRLRQWTGWLARPAPFGALVAETPAGLVGLISYGAPDNPVYAGRAEIEHLYVKSACRGRRLGRALLDRAMDRMRGAGFCGTGLAVVRENAAARAFYARTGGQEVAAFTDPGPLWRSDNLLVVWDWPATAA